jgi:ketosteroid isomerase-like protein
MTDRTQTVQQLYSAFADGDASSLQEMLADTHLFWKAIGA